LPEKLQEQLLQSILLLEQATNCLVQLLHPDWTSRLPDLLAVIVQAEHGFEQEQTTPLPEKAALVILPQDCNRNPGQEIQEQLDHIVFSGHEAAATSASGLGAANGAEGAQVKIGHDPGQLFPADFRLGQHPDKRVVGCQLRSKIGIEPVRQGKAGMDASAIKILHGKKRLRAHHGFLE